MLFTRLGYVLAFFALLLGVLMTLSSVLNYYRGIDWTPVSGVYLIVFGIALGILAEIRLALRRDA